MRQEAFSVCAVYDEFHSPQYTNPQSTQILMSDYQSRVRLEKEELDRKLALLLAFHESDAFLEVPAEECRRLYRQIEAMDVYSGILAERIEAFPK